MTQRQKDLIAYLHVRKMAAQAERKRRNLTQQDVMEAVAMVTGIPAKEMIAERFNRKRKQVYARHFVMYFIRSLMNVPFIEIAKVFEKDHSTVIYSVKQIENVIDIQDATYFPMYERIKKRLEF